MFTTGRIVFAIFFVLAFITLMVYSYKKDAKNHQKYYKNSAIYVAIALLVAILILFTTKYIFKG